MYGSVVRRRPELSQNCSPRRPPPQVLGPTIFATVRPDTTGVKTRLGQAALYLTAWARPFHIPPRPRHQATAECTVAPK
jgi:hypothetical protein